MSNLLKKEKGFTLIEIVLVLAIAGLLLVIVFLAVSGAQKSRRDTQRKNDLSRVAAQLESYASNNNGSYPTNAQFPTATFASSTYITGANLLDPTTGAAYSYSAAANPSGVGNIAYQAGIACDGSAIGRGYSVKIGLEQGVSCRDNK